MSQQHPPTIPLSMSDILTIDSALRGYLSYVKGAVPASTERDVEIQKLQDLRTRLRALPENETPHMVFCIPLTREDIEALTDALRGFTHLVNMLVPSSQERDAVLQSFEDLRQQLALMIDTTPK